MFLLVMRTLKIVCLNFTCSGLSYLYILYIIYRSITKYMIHIHSKLFDNQEIPKSAKCQKLKFG